MGLPPLKTLNLESYFETYPISIGSGDKEVQQQLKIIGGRPFNGSFFSVTLTDKPDSSSAVVSHGPEVLYDFGSKEISELIKAMPQYYKDGRLRFKEGGHQIRTRLLQSTHQ